MTPLWLCCALLLSADAPIAIQGAVDTELAPLIEAAGNPDPRDVHGFRFWVGTIADTPVVISRTEVGMVHAAMATTILIREYAPRIIINQGTAGGVNPELVTGDIVLGEASVPFGATRTAPRGKGEGIEIDDWVMLPVPMRAGEERVRTERFEGDPDLLARASRVPYDGGRIVKGVVGTADQWNREVDKLLWAHDAYAIDSEDMESSAAHQAAQIHGVPFLAIRILSNSEHHDGTFRRELGAECARFVVELVETLAE